MRLARPSRRTSRRLPQWSIAAALVLFIAPGIVSPPTAAAAAAAPGAWATTGQMSLMRAFAPAVALGDGTVITAGGTDSLSFTAAAERWRAGTWSPAGSIGHAAAGQVAALLPNGQALFAGGSDEIAYYGFGDVFNPTGGAWTQTPAMAHNHAYAVGASLANGDVMVIGGYDGGDTLTTAAVDIYLAARGTWSSVAPLPGVGRYAMTATTLANGRVLVAGGNDGTAGSAAVLGAAQIYTSGSGWAATGGLNVARFDHAAALLTNGQVLVAGGSDAGGRALSTAELYDPATGRWSLTGAMLFPRSGLTLTVLPDGRVLAVGGYTSSLAPAQTSAELYDPSTGGWSPTGSLRAGRRYQAAVKVVGGGVMVMGGQGEDGGAYLRSAEIYTPAIRVNYAATTYHALTPVRLLDTRRALGLSGAFSARAPRSFQVSGKATVPTAAVAVTGIVTVSGPGKGGYITVGPTVSSTPGSSTLNILAGDDRANNVTVALDVPGTLAMVYVPSSSGGTVNLIFDVTGYFTKDDTGATFKPLNPIRIIDSRYGTGGVKKFVAGTPQSFAVSVPAGLPANAVAVTGNLTVVNPSGRGFAFVGPSIPTDATTLTTSTLNLPAGDTRANGVTVALNVGMLSAAWVGPKGSAADIIFDVTGYFVSGTTGARFVPMEPIRLADTRINQPVQGPIPTNRAATVLVRGRAGVPTSAMGITGNLTIVGETCSGNLSVSPHPSGASSTTSNLNVPKGDIRANGFAMSLWTDGSVGLVYGASGAGCTTHFVMDLTGYFAP